MAADGSRTLKILVLGSSEVGKTSLLNVYNGVDFLSEYQPTLQSDFSVRDVVIGDSEISAQIWDIGGNGTMGRSFLRGTHGIILVVDITISESMQQLDKFYERVKVLANFADDNFPCILVGNKLDIADKKGFKQITEEVMRLWTKARRTPIQDNIPIFFTSAKDGRNVNLIFETIFKMALDKPAKIMVTPPSSSIANGSYHGNFSDAGSVLSSLILKSNQSPMLYDNLQKPKASSLIDSIVSGDDEPATAKVIIAGSPCVGKTCILHKFTGDEKDMNTYEPTIGADFRISEMPSKNRTLSLQIWDSAGDLKQIQVARSIYKNADCLVLVYDISNRKSFEALETYWNNYITHGQPLEPDEFPCLLVGNKCDLSDKRAVPLEEVIDWCTFKRPRKPITYIECSALRGIGIQDIFVFVADSVYDYAIRLDDEGSDVSDGSQDPDDLSNGDTDDDFDNGYLSESKSNRANGSGRPKVGEKDLEQPCWLNLRCLGFNS
jgi:Ras-related protein Rab-7A